MFVGDVRYRLLWELLAESGMRLGEALSVRHGDWQMGRGETPFVSVVPRDHPHGVAAKSGARRVFVSARLDRLYGDLVWRLVEEGADAAVDDWDAMYLFCNLRRGERFAPLRPKSVYAQPPDGPVVA